jgi:S-DNA-T family DNA segregation ATPase FtsK/SpoIIIE
MNVGRQEPSDRNVPGYDPMAQHNLTTQRQRELIGEITRLLTRRLQEEKAIRERYETRQREAAADRDHQRQLATHDLQTKHAQLIAHYRDTREESLRQYETGGLELARTEQAFERRTAVEQSEFLETAQTVREDRLLRVSRAFVGRDTLLRQELAQFQAECERRNAEREMLLQEAQAIIARRCRWPMPSSESPTVEPGFSHAVYLERAVAALQRARLRIAELHNRPAARFVEDGWPIVIGVFLVVAAAFPAWLLFRDFGWAAVTAACLVSSIGLALAIRQIARVLSKRQTMRVVPAFQAENATAWAELNAAREASQRAADRALRKLTKNRDRELEQVETEHAQTCAEWAAAAERKRAELLAELRTRRQALVHRQEQQLQTAEQELPRLAALEQNYQRRMDEIAEAYRARRLADRAEFERQWNELAESWSTGLAHFQSAVREMNKITEEHFPSWEVLAADPAHPVLPALTKKPQAEVPLAQTEEGFVPLGHYEFSFARLAGETDAALRVPEVRQTFRLPVVLSNQEHPSLLLEAEGPGRDQATRVLQNAMLRMLTLHPPGKVRFTIIDPVGLGRNFSAFMHLADYDERLVASRIWTESNHINQRLVDLSEHMEDVIQKYLRNEFASIQEYNAQAGEIAEPYHILVVANFPANFSDEAVRRLASIASSGARCGVYTFISVDTKLKLPGNFHLADLEAHATTLRWNAERRQFTWNYDDLQSLPITLEGPPDDERFTALVRAVGSHAKDALRVEVPFDAVVVPADRWWRGDSRQGIEVPLGRAGAKKLQYMRLGQGTSQHVLIAGKTGSGKSTLLNALITNLAVHYSPNELHFYLIDFKKGVEFKAYAALRLPHARVIAIESEREFGLSVLERLDLELKQRGDLFRKAGVQDVKGYRNTVPDAAMPRILLVIDEFQEFFTTDDKIAHEASLLLDRLVRQGRAFGIHVLLGSQTLAGAYSLARSTIGQMAVRIALQCSESDAHLILSEDNTAARLLNRPGEAIYNDANGLLEGNHPFQVVWLSDDQRESYLSRIAARAAQETALELRPPIVFEGNVAADPRENHLLHEALRASPASGSSAARRAWLGSPVAIKDPTEVVFQRESGNNLLIVGQQEELALGILTNALICLAAQQGANGAAATDAGSSEPLSSFYLLDGSRADSPEAAAWRTFLGRVPLALKTANPQTAGRVIQSIAEEVTRRMEKPEQWYESIFLVVHNLPRFRDLKKSDDFGISSFDDNGNSAAVDKQFGTILSEGPALGVHTLVWCDAYSNLSRWLDRQTIRDFKLRVLLQMGATDSSNLMDSPLASRLGTHMALLYSEEQGQAEKFRPYGAPSVEWMESVRQHIQARSHQTGTKVPVG